MNCVVKTKELLNNYLFFCLLPEVTNLKCPTKLNVRIHFKDYLCKQGIEPQASEELSLSQLHYLLDKIINHLDDWIRSGVPYPFWQSEEQDELFITWRHSKYEELTGYCPITEKFISILQWLERLSSREFLIACAVYLKILGATKIFITDGPHDGGIDLIGKIEQSPFNSLIFFIQAKTGTLITRDAVLMEYGKYLSLPHEKIYQQYREVLGVDRSVDGASYCYSIFGNCSFNPPAKGISSKLGILLRSKIQIAHFLSKIYEAEALEKIKQNLLSDCIRPDLSLNIAEKI